MPDSTPQTLANHAKLDPPFHFFLAPVGLILLGAAIYELVRNPGMMGAFHVLAVVWAIVAIFKMRIYSLKVQDRVIRLEERLRMERVLPESLQPRILELTESQLIALRFACDTELSSLVQKTLSGNLASKDIKKSVQTWRPDYFRV
jgi:hypothetical protein